MPPGINEALPEACKCGKYTGDEDCTATSEDVVERDRKPTADRSAA